MNKCEQEYNKIVSELKHNWIPLDRVISAKCMECANFQVSEIKHCPIKDCVLYKFRPYQPVERDILQSE